MLSVVREGEELPVAFWSRSLKDREKNYPVSELECLAIVDGILHFAPYMRPAHFVVETDHHFLSFLRTASFTNAHLARWAMKLQPYAFTFLVSLFSILFISVSSLFQLLSVASSLVLFIHAL